MKRYLLLLLVTLLPLVANAETVEINGIYYNLVSEIKEAEVTSNPNGYSGAVNIPESITYIGEKYSVTSVGNESFRNCIGLTSVTIPESVTNISDDAFSVCRSLTSITIPNSVTCIGDGAFSSCSSLTSLTIPNSVNSIGNYAFYDCRSLTSVTIGSGVTSIGYNSFYHCSSLTSVTLESNTIVSASVGANSSMKSIFGDQVQTYIVRNAVTSIGDYVFYGCSGLTSITIPESVTSIGSGSFYGCSSLTSITIPNSVTSIGESAFSRCSGLTSITIPESVTSIGHSTFSGCSGLTSVTIPNSVTDIGEEAFYGCGSLTSITIPNSVTDIGDYAFHGCSGLTSVTIPNSVTSIGKSAFSHCSGLTSIEVEAENTNYDSRNNSNAIIETGTNTLIEGCMNTIIPNSVTSIGYRAFYGCSGLTTITIPNSMISIGDVAFQDCSGLEKVIVPDIAAWCGILFGDNPLLYSHHIFSDEETEITDLIIPEGVTSISDKVFSSCSGLTSVTIPNSVTSIGKNAFSDCSGLTSITIPNSVTSIGNYAFGGCSSLTSVTIGSGVTNINKYAFSSCRDLKKMIWLPNTPPYGYNNISGAINYVPNEQYTDLQNKVVYPFLNHLFAVNGIYYVPLNPSERTCEAIDCVYDETVSIINLSSTVPYRGITMNVQNVQPYICYNNKYIKSLYCEYNGNIENNTFYGCTGITSIVCNNSGDVEQDAFKGCTSITSVECNNDGDIQQNTFNGCTGITKVICNNSGAIGDNAFSGCKLLDNIVLGNRVKNIGTNAFNDCETIQSICIPASIDTISNNAFKGCTGLKALIIANRENILSLGSNDNSPLFADCPLDSVYIGGKLSYNTSSDYGYSPFYRNTALRTVVISDKETEISPNEFYGCTNLQNFTIGDGVVTFGDWAFSGCTSLKSLSFGSQLSSIGKEVFSDCTSVTKIVSKAVTPPSCGDQALDGIDKWECTLYVPKGSLTFYQGAEQWKQFFFVIEGTDPDVQPDLDKKCATPTISYANGKLTFNCETEGADFISEITDTDIKKYYDKSISLSATYTITVYATKDGYENSEVATGTLCWIDVAPQTEGIVNEDAVMEVKAMPVLIQSQGGTISIQGATEGTPIAVYDTEGKQYGNTIAEKDRATITTSLRPGSIAVVKIGEKAVKVLLK